MTAVGEPMLRVEGLSKSFGSLRAVNGVSFSVQAGERRAIIGPNGAGKTTLFDMIGGATRATSGRILFAGDDVTRLPEHRRIRRGMAKTFQRSSLFEQLSVYDNVTVAVQRQLGHSRVLHRRRTSFGDVRDGTDELLATVGLEDRGSVRAAALSHGERRQLELALALALRPRLLLFDEPAAGMSAEERRRLVALIQALPQDLTILLIEHDIDLVFSVASHVAVLAASELIADGRPEEIAASEQVQEAYLGAADTEEIFIS